MLDEIRDHDPLPTEKEQRWMALDTIAALARVIALAAVALFVGWTTSAILEDGGREPGRAVAHR